MIVVMDNVMLINLFRLFAMISLSMSLTSCGQISDDEMQNAVDYSLKSHIRDAISVTYSQFELVINVGRNYHEVERVYEACVGAVNYKPNRNDMFVNIGRQLTLRSLDKPGFSNFKLCVSDQVDHIVLNSHNLLTVLNSPVAEKLSSMVEFSDQINEIKKDGAITYKELEKLNTLAYEMQDIIAKRELERFGANK